MPYFIILSVIRITYTSLSLWIIEINRSKCSKNISRFVRFEVQTKPILSAIEAVIALTGSKPTKSPLVSIDKNTMYGRKHTRVVNLLMAGFTDQQYPPYKLIFYKWILFLSFWGYRFLMFLWLIDMIFSKVSSNGISLTYKS